MTKKRIRLFRHCGKVGGIIGFCLINACVSPIKFHGRVIERSKESAPTWIDLPPGKFHTTGDYFSFKAIKEYVHDLPLGVRQAQRLAYTDGRNLVHKYLRELILKKGSISGKKIDLKSLDQSLRNLSQGLKAKDFEIIDIYYETYEIHKAERELGTPYSSVFVLAYFSKSKMNELLEKFQLGKV